MSSVEKKNLGRKKLDTTEAIRIYLVYLKVVLHEEVHIIFNRPQS